MKNSNWLLSIKINFVFMGIVAIFFSKYFSNPGVWSALILLQVLLWVTTLTLFKSHLKKEMMWAILMK